MTPAPDPHDGWTPQPQEQVQPGDPWRDDAPVTDAGHCPACSGWIEPEYLHREPCPGVSRQAEKETA